MLTNKTIQFNVCDYVIGRFSSLTLCKFSEDNSLEGNRNVVCKYVLGVINVAFLYIVR